jgi:hypothetical protein
VRTRTSTPCAIRGTPSRGVRRREVSTGWVVVEIRGIAIGWRGHGAIVELRRVAQVRRSTIKRGRGTSRNRRLLSVRACGWSGRERLLRERVRVRTLLRNDSGIYRWSTGRVGGGGSFTDMDVLNISTTKDDVVVHFVAGWDASCFVLSTFCTKGPHILQGDSRFLSINRIQDALVAYFAL